MYLQFGKLYKHVLLHTQIYNLLKWLIMISEKMYKTRAILAINPNDNDI